MGPVISKVKSSFRIKEVTVNNNSNLPEVPDRDNSELLFLDIPVEVSLTTL